MSTPPMPLGPLATIVESARQTLARLLRHRVRWVVLGMALLLAAASWLLGRTAHERVTGEVLACALLWWLLATVLMPWATLYLGVHAVHGDLEDRTAQYLFLRPVGRVPLLLGKWLATAVAGLVVGLLGIAAVVGGLLPHQRLWEAGGAGAARTALVFAAAIAAGALAYAAAAAAFSAIFRRPLLWAALFVVGLQQLAANLPVSAAVRQATIADPMRRIVLDGLEPEPRLAELLWPAQRFAPELLGSPLQDLAWTLGCCLLLAAWFYARSEYDSRPRD
jgi:hypothetical protein